MINKDMTIDPIEQIVIFNAIRHARQTGFWKIVSKTPKGKVSLIAWEELAKRLEDKLEMRVVK